MKRLPLDGNPVHFPTVTSIVVLSKVPSGTIVPKRAGSGLPFKPLNELVSYHFPI